MCAGVVSLLGSVYHSEYGQMEACYSGGAPKSCQALRLRVSLYVGPNMILSKRESVTRGTTARPSSNLKRYYTRDLSTLSSIGCNG